MQAIRVIRKVGVQRLLDPNELEPELEDDDGFELEPQDCFG